MLKSFEKIYRNRAYLSLLIALAATLVALVLSISEAAATLELKSYDLCFSIRGQQDTSNRNIAIVNIDDRSFKSLPEKWPFSRALYARVIRNLKTAGARLIIVDIEFFEPNRRIPQDDQALINAVRAAGNVLLASKLVVERDGTGDVINTYLSEPLPQLKAAGAKPALINAVEDVDGFIRKYLLFQPYGGKLHESLATAAFRMLFEVPASLDDRNRLFYLGSRAVPRVGYNTMFINYRGPAGTFPTYSIADVVDDRQYKLVGDDDDDIFELHKQWQTFRNKIVLIGASAEELQDNKLTPFYSYGGGKQRTPGVEVHANALSTLLSGDFLTPGDGRLFLLITLMLGWLIAWLSLQSRPWTGVGFAVGVSLVYSIFAYLVFSKLRVQPEFFIPLTGFAISYVGSVLFQVIYERREKGRVKHIFQKYVAESVVEKMLATGAMPRFGGERREMTVLFSDIRAFTNYCERHTAEGVVHRLHEYLTEMVEIIKYHQGTLDKFVGDEIMALYGAPMFYREHAIHACETACDMINSLRELQKRWSARSEDFFQIGIGINTGKMIVGNLGSAQHFDYTVIGDEVNLAARLEGANKQYWSSIIISEATYEQAKPRAVVRELDLVRVKGKQKPVRIFELRSMRPVPDIEQDLLINVYHQGLEQYKQHRWYEALQQFKRVLRYFPTDGPCRVYTGRCLEFLENPPAPTWDGVYEFTTK